MESFERRVNRAEALGQGVVAALSGRLISPPNPACQMLAATTCGLWKNNPARPAGTWDGTFGFGRTRDSAPRRRKKEKRRGQGRGAPLGTSGDQNLIEMPEYSDFSVQLLLLVAAAVPALKKQTPLAVFLSSRPNLFSQ